MPGLALAWLALPGLALAWLALPGLALAGLTPAGQFVDAFGHLSGALGYSVLVGRQRGGGVLCGGDGGLERAMLRGLEPVRGRAHRLLRPPRPGDPAADVAAPEAGGGLSHLPGRPAEVVNRLGGHLVACPHRLSHVAGELGGLRRQLGLLPRQPLPGGGGARHGLARHRHSALIGLAAGRAAAHRRAHHHRPEPALAGARVSPVAVVGVLGLLLAARAARCL